MAKRKLNAAKSKSGRAKSKRGSTRARAASAKGKAAGTRTRRPAVGKASRTPAPSDSDPVGPKTKSSRTASQAGRLLKKISRAATKKEAREIAREIKNLGNSKKNKHWYKEAQKARDKRYKQLERNAKRKRIKRNSARLGRSTTRGKRRKRGR